MTEIVSWIVSHWDVLVGLVFALGVVASGITALTSTPKDDEIVRKILAFLSFLQPRTSEGTLKAPLSRPAAPAEAPLLQARDLPKE